MMLSVLTREPRISNGVSQNPKETPRANAILQQDSGAKSLSSEPAQNPGDGKLGRG
jgi:hypothetical protein